MKLSKIKIFDFRSILNQEINFGENCIGLIGLNESGKSNVLNAIRILDNNYQLSFKDKSKISRKFPKIDCEFVLDDGDKEKLKSLEKEYCLDITHSSEFQLSISAPQAVIQTVHVVDSSGVISRDISFHFSAEITVSSTVAKLTNPSGIPSGSSTSEFQNINRIKNLWIFPLRSMVEISLTYSITKPHINSLF